MFIETVAVAKCYLIITHVKYVKINKSKKQPSQTYLPVKLTDRRMSIKKGKKSSHLIYNFDSLSKMAGETERFS